MGGEKSGFTIIETMLYFAVTGVLAIGVLASAGYAINVQRYRDAASSLVTYLQAQYDETANVQNDRTNDLECTAGNIQVGGDVTERGRSDCVILGKFIQTDDGVTFTSTAVFGTLSALSATSDVDALKKAAPFTSADTMTPSSYTLEWGARIVKPKSTTVQAPLSIFIARSPASGTIMTFIGYSSADTPISIMDNAPADALLCVDASDFYAGDHLGALLAQGSANASGVKMATGDTC